MSPIRSACLAALPFLFGSVLTQADTPPLSPDIPKNFTMPTQSYDYVKRVAMIPMRDGTKLYTVIMIPKGAHNAPMILTRTPYNAAKRAEREVSGGMLASLMR